MYFITSGHRRYFHFQSLVIALIILIPTSHATCYWPNGDTQDDYVQCPSGLSCCLKGETCLSNGLCFTANFGILYRGACADESWPIAECPRACYTEIDSGWANLFQCNTSTNLLTCNHEYTSAGIVCNGYGVGTYDGYTSANVTAAQVGITDDATTTNTTNSTSTNSTSTYNDGSTSTDSSKLTVTTCPSATSSKNDSELLVLGIGLGAGLGIPLLIATGLLIYCGGQNRKHKKEIQRISEIPRTPRPQNLRPGLSNRAELYTSFTYPELEGSTAGKMELPGSCPSYKN
ncbi:hypothetical protein N7486_000824 [Penicillium sp. IBT 16267x]|nr:hypothetical protein N7486_000824 [Penicillium sp. IBT 16267x]